MKNIRLTLRSIARNKKTSFIKILSLSIGFAIALILFAKVNFDLSYDTFFPDSDQIYQIVMKHNYKADEELQTADQIFGGAALGFKSDVPNVESATRYVYIGWDESFYDDSENKFKGNFILADSCLFDVLSRPIISGDPRQVLSQTMHAMVSKSIADAIDGDVIGKQITMNSGKVLTIGGVFEDIPKNSNIVYDIAVSMPSISNFFWDDSSKHIFGGTRYTSFVKLAKGTDPNSLTEAIHQMQVKYQDIDNLSAKWGGSTQRYELTKLIEQNKENPSVKRSILIMNILAIAILLTCVLNYILFTISSILERGRNVGVYKTYGATSRNITQMMIVETLVYFIVSILFAILWIYLGKGVISNIFGLSVSILFTSHSITILLGIMLVIFLLTTIVPSYMLSSTPVISAFRSLKQNRSVWKKSLLLILFSGSTFLLALLVIVSLQYRKFMNADIGLDNHSLVIVYPKGEENLNTAYERLSQLPYIENIAKANFYPLLNAGANNISLIDSDKELFNIADFWNIDHNYVPTLGMKIIEGSNFSENSSPLDIIISKELASRLISNAGWTDGVINKNVNVSDHKGPLTIVGVYEDVPIWALTNNENKPSAFFYNPQQTSSVVVKLSEITGDRILEIQKIIDEIQPDRENQVINYRYAFVAQYDTEDRFKQSVIIIGIVTLLINMIGLIGYLQNEIIRRSAEIAIRKINGATLSNILALFVKDILYLSLPALLVGSFGAYYVGQMWMQDFAVKVSMNPLIFICCALFLIVIILPIIVLSCIKISNQNPVESLKQE